jgi:hypothetical protein
MAFWKLIPYYTPQARIVEKSAVSTPCPYPLLHLHMLFFHKSWSVALLLVYSWCALRAPLVLHPFQNIKSSSFSSLLSQNKSLTEKYSIQRELREKARCLTSMLTWCDSILPGQNHNHEVPVTRGVPSSCCQVCTGRFVACGGYKIAAE